MKLCRPRRQLGGQASEKRSRRRASAHIHAWRPASRRCTPMRKEADAAAAGGPVVAQLGAIPARGAAGRPHAPSAREGGWSHCHRRTARAPPGCCAHLQPRRQVQGKQGRRALSLSLRAVQTHRVGCSQYSNTLCAYGHFSPRMQLPVCGGGRGRWGAQGRCHACYRQR